MAVTVKKGTDDFHSVIAVDGRFTFDVRDQCLAVIDAVPPRARRITIDLTRTEYLDSAALGMLIRAREKFKGAQLGLKVKAKSPASEILEVANFHKMFRYEAI